MWVCLCEREKKVFLVPETSTNFLRWFGATLSRDGGEEQPLRDTIMRVDVKKCRWSWADTFFNFLRHLTTLFVGVFSFLYVQALASGFLLFSFISRRRVWILTSKPDGVDGLHKARKKEKQRNGSLSKVWLVCHFQAEESMWVLLDSYVWWPLACPTRQMAVGGQSASFDWNWGRRWAIFTASNYQGKRAEMSLCKLCTPPYLPLLFHAVDAARGVC